MRESGDLEFSGGTKKRTMTADLGEKRSDGQRTVDSAFSAKLHTNRTLLGRQKVRTFL